MGRSTTTSSCLKIITCGGSHPSETDDLLLPSHEVIGSSDRRGWSFRKRSARHRVLSNTVNSENLASANKESPESVESNVQKADASASAEKFSVVECQDEKPGLSVPTEQKVGETVGVENAEGEVDSQPDESIIIVIQTAIRGFLAQRELLKLKNVVKLQAAVRGHMVRQHAVGALRCLQAIVKMQALVRSHQAKGGPFSEKESAQKCGTVSSETLDKERSVGATYISIEKLLSNSFARQLTESTPKSKPINIKCDPLKPNSAWYWLERWMSVSSADPRPKTELAIEEVEVKNDNINNPAECRARAPSEGTCDLLDVKTDGKEIVIPSEGEENPIIYEAENLKSDSIGPTSMHGINLDLPDDKETSAISNIIGNLEQPEMNSETVPDDPQVEGEQPDETKQCMEKPSMDQLETEGKKYVFGSRKASNPSYIAAQSKFEELSSAGSISRLSGKEPASSSMDTFSSGFETATRENEVKVVQNVVPHSSAVQYGDSECGTELSITSTLDSPDGFDAGAANDEHEAKVAEEYLGPEAKGAAVNLVPDSSSLFVDETEKFDGTKDESLLSCVAANSPREELTERNASDIQIGGESETGGPAYPEASPRSHVTIPESHGTPSSQVSVKAKKSRTDKSGSSLKRKSLSTGKRSPSHQSYEAVASSSVEQLPKDQQNAKRRNSFGSTRPENPELEVTDGGSSNSLPRFMQVTESARAKMNPNNSPRSSPDVQDREYVKKRHSLPGANGRQGSPRIQRSMSQAQPGAKANGSYVVHEKKWQR